LESFRAGGGDTYSTVSELRRGLTVVVKGKGFQETRSSVPPDLLKPSIEPGAFVVQLDKSAKTKLTLILKFHQLKTDRCAANVLGPVRYRITIDNIACSELCFRDSAVCPMGADLSPLNDADNVGRM